MQVYNIPYQAVADTFVMTAQNSLLIYFIALTLHLL
jgi:hypothetical protein